VTDGQGQGNRQVVIVQPLEVCGCGLQQTLLHAQHHRVNVQGPSLSALTLGYGLISVTEKTGEFLLIQAELL
jgi:hypothetical protein